MSFSGTRQPQNSISLDISFDGLSSTQVGKGIAGKQILMKDKEILVMTLTLSDRVRPIPIYRYRYTDTDIPIPIYR